jgi:hypothetical protein
MVEQGKNTMNKKVFLAMFLLSSLPGMFSSASGDDGVTLEDSDIAGVWLFDEFTYPHTTLTDASEYAKADVSLLYGGRMVAGRFGDALAVSGSDYAVCYVDFAGRVPQE